LTTLYYFSREIGSYNNVVYLCGVAHGDTIIFHDIRVYTGRYYTIGSVLVAPKLISIVFRFASVEILCCKNMINLMTIFHFALFWTYFLTGKHGNRRLTSKTFAEVINIISKIIIIIRV